nr:MAG TPA: hypothetical protein [Caudoviricetes sp.]
MCSYVLPFLLYFFLLPIGVLCPAVCLLVSGEISLIGRAPYF